MNKENTSEEPETAENDSNSEEPSHCSEKKCSVIEQNESDREYDARALTAILTIKGDFDRQLELVSDRQNTMIQSLGIILAFASVLLVSTMRMVQLRFDSIPEMISIAALFTCCLIGITTIREWKNWKLFTGSNLNEVITVFNEENYTKLYHLLLEGVVRSYDAMTDNNYILKRRITSVVLTLLIGTAFTVFGMVIEWV
ncbi:MAG: hypothetical protein FWC44_01740 [Methanomassiliicoccaceae archaeon]|nr:hypothetical protein [Methanomassiliicoccaceae archaeon]